MERGAVGTLLAVEPTNMTGKHRDGEQNPLERAQFSEDESKVVGGGTSHADQGENFVFQAEVRIDLETARVDVRHFVRLPIDRQQRGATSKSTDRGGNYLIQADVGGESETATIAQVAVRQAARQPIGQQQQGTTSIEQIKQFDSGGSWRNHFFSAKTDCRFALYYCFSLTANFTCLSC